MKYHKEKKNRYLKVFIQTDSLFEVLFDKMADWLRKLNAYPLGSVRVVSNLIFVMLLIGCMMKRLALWDVWDG